MEKNWIRKPHSELMRCIETEGVTYLSFDALSQTGLVRHGFSTRFGGVSEGCFSTMNLTFNRGDNPEHVMENYNRMAGALGVEKENMVLSCQTHTVEVRKVTAEDAGKGVTIPRDYTDIDGLITNERGLTLVTFYADCVPLYLLDPVNRAIGLSHSGWRGTVGKMGAVTVNAMVDAYGTKAEDLIVCIGPSICQDCYEVGEDVAKEFKHAFPESIWPQLLGPPSADRKYQLNLWEANRFVFKESGVRTENIHITDICTHCNPDYLYSHRSMGNERGNLAAFLQLK